MRTAKSKREYDLTRGPILQRLLLVAVPIMGTTLMTTIYNLTDMFWLGRVGSGAVAASGTAGMYLWLIQAAIMVGRMGSEIGVAQYLGRGEPEEAKTRAQTSLLLAALLGAACAAGLFVFRGPLLGLLNIQEAAVAADASLYLAIVSAGVLPTFLSSALGGAFTGAGNSRTPFWINAAGVALNLVLDPLLIFGLGWGIAGAAIATSTAQLAVCALSFVAIHRSGGRPFARWRSVCRPRREVVAQIFRWSTPIAVESLLFTTMSLVITRYINGFGTAAIAVQRIGNQVESLSWLIGGGFASAVTAFVGQNFGAQRWGRIRQGMRVSTLAMAVYGLLVTLVLYFGGGALFRLFLHEEELIEIGAQYLRILAACQLVACVEYNSAGAFRGLGRTLPSSVVTAVSNLLRIPLVVLLGNRFGLSGIWWGLSLGACLRSVWMFAWFLLLLRRLPQQADQADQAEPGPGSAG